MIQSKQKVLVWAADMEQLSVTDPDVVAKPRLLHRCANMTSIHNTVACLV